MNIALVIQSAITHDLSNLGQLLPEDLTTTCVVQQLQVDILYIQAMP